MGRVEVTILVIVAAPIFGYLLAILVDRLPRSGPLPIGETCCSSGARPRRAADRFTALGSLRLRNRCRACAARGFAEAALLGAAAIGIALWAILAAAPAWPSALLGWTLLVLSIIDWRHFLLPDALTLPLICIGVTVGGVFGSLPDSIVGAAGAAAFFVSIAWAFRRVSGKEGLGMGDAKLFAAGGAWAGWQALPGILMVAALLGLAYAALGGRVGEGRNRPIPFGPFLAAGIWLSWLYGPVVL